MSVVVLVLILVVVAVAVGLLVAMFARDKPFYGVVALGILLAPATVLAFTYITIV